MLSSGVGQTLRRCVVRPHHRCYRDDQSLLTRHASVTAVQSSSLAEARTRDNKVLRSPFTLKASVLRKKYPLLQKEDIDLLRAALQPSQKHRQSVQQQQQPSNVIKKTPKRVFPDKVNPSVLSRTML